MPPWDKARPSWRPVRSGRQQAAGNARLDARGPGRRSGIAAFKKGGTTKLDVHGLIEKPLDRRPPRRRRTSRARSTTSASASCSRSSSSSGVRLRLAKRQEARRHGQARSAESADLHRRPAVRRGTAQGHPARPLRQGPEPRHLADGHPGRLRVRAAARRGRRVRAEGRQPGRGPDAALPRRQADASTSTSPSGRTRSCCRSASSAAAASSACSSTRPA